MSDPKRKAAQSAKPSAAEADPIAACASVAIGLLTDYYADAEAAGRLPADAAGLLARLRALPNWIDDPGAWASALSAILPDYALPSEPELESRSELMAHALRAISEALGACGGPIRDRAGRAWVTRRSGDPATGASYRQLTLATFHAGFGVALASGEFATEPAKEIRKRFAKLGVAAKLDRDPKQWAKRKIRESWEGWQAGQELHKSQAAFARAMCDRHSEITSPQTVERWAREWAKERKAGTR